MPFKLKPFLLTFMIIAGFAAMPGRAEALMISPVTVEIQAEPGTETMQSFVIVNDGASPVVLKLTAEDFRPAGSSGAPDYFVDDSPGAASKWISFPEQSVTLQAKERRSLEYHLAVPQGVTPGGHYAVVFAAAEKNSTRDSGIQLTPRVGVLLMIRVPGQIMAEGRVIGFGLTSGKTTLTHLPADFAVEFQNTGNVHLKPEGVIKIRDAWGTLRAELPVNVESGAALPNSTRTFTAKWNLAKIAPDSSEWERQWKNGPLGSYHATLLLGYEGQGLKEMGRFNFFIFPYQTVIFWGIVLLAVVLFFMRLLASYRHHLTRLFDAYVKKYGRAQAEAMFGIHKPGARS
ncbi:MAG: hypothetical protein V1821_02825 [bacterium]